MKKVAITLAVVLAAADGVALWVYLQHKKSQASAPPQAAAPAEPAPGPAAAPQPLPSNAMARPEEPSYGGDDAVTPGGCHSPAECDAYCAEPAHRQECLDFIGPSAAGAAAAAPVPGAGPSAGEPDAGRQEDPNRDQPGPGGCRGEMECAAYCSNPSRREECREFTAEAKKRMAAGVRQAPASQRACLKGRLGSKKYALLLKGRLDPDDATNRAMSACMRKGDVGPKRDPNKGMESLSGAPAGCTDMASCTAACMKPENCAACLAWKGLPEQFRSMLNCGEE